MEWKLKEMINCRDKALGSYHDDNISETGSPFWDLGISVKTKQDLFYWVWRSFIQ